MSKQSSNGIKPVISGIKELEKNKYLARKRLPTGRVEYYINYDKKPDVQKGYKATQKPDAQNGNKPKRQQAKKGTISNTNNILIKKKTNKDLLLRNKSKAPEKKKSYSLLVSERKEKVPQKRKDNRNPDIEFVYMLFEKEFEFRPPPIKGGNGFDLNRGSAQRLVKRFGKQGVAGMLAQVFEAQKKDRYFKKCTCPLDLERNLIDYKIYFNKETTKEEFKIAKI